MSNPKDQPQDAAEDGNANPPVSNEQPSAAPETDTDDEQPVDEDGDDDDDEEIPESRETRAPELPDETLAERD